MSSERINYCCGRPLFSCNKALNKLWYKGCGFSRTNDACAECRLSTVDLERCLFSECGLHRAMKHRKIRIGVKRDWINFLRFKRGRFTCLSFVMNSYVDRCLELCYISGSTQFMDLRCVQTL